MRVDGVLPPVRSGVPPEYGLAAVRERAMKRLAKGGSLRQASRELSGAMRSAAAGWIQSALTKYPPPHPVCFVQLGSTARDEAVPGIDSSSDIDYAIVTGAPYSSESFVWAARVSEELQRLAHEQGFEFCHKLNGANVFVSPNSWFSQSDALFEGGNLFTARFMAGDKTVCAQLLSYREDFRLAEDGDPNAAYPFLRPKRIQFNDRAKAWSKRMRAEIDKQLKKGASERLGPGTDPSGFWKQQLQIGVVAMQNFAVSFAFDAYNTFDRIDEAVSRGLMDAKLGRDASRAVEFFMEQKAAVKRGASRAKPSDAAPHLEVLDRLLQRLETAL